MIRFIYALCLVLLICLVVLLYKNNNDHPTEPTMRDGRTWELLDMPNQHEAHELLTKAYNKIIKYLRLMKQKYHVSETDEMIEREGISHHNIAETRAHKAFTKILTKFDPDQFYENYPGIKPGTSFTIDKGVSMYMCLRQVPNKSELVSENTLVFVMLHELAHIGTYDEWDHGIKFWSTFKFMLQEAVESGIYELVDYSVHPSDYCSMRISYQPLLDKSITDFNSLGV